MKKLFLVHCGFYDKEFGEGLYEGHINYFVAASSFDEARARAKELPEFKQRSMHVDGMQEIVAVDGFAVTLEPSQEYEGKTALLTYRPRGHAAKLTVSPDSCDKK